MNQPRFVVRECEGYATPAGNGTRKHGLSVVVLDRLWDYQIIHQWRSEHCGRGQHGDKVRRIRELATTLADQLNAETP